MHTQTDTQTYVDKRNAIALIARGDGPSDCGTERGIRGKERTAETAAQVQRQRRTHGQRKLRCPVVAVVVVLQTSGLDVRRKRVRDIDVVVVSSNRFFAPWLAILRFLNIYGWVYG